MSDLEKARAAFREHGIGAPLVIARAVWRRWRARRVAEALAGGDDLTRKFSLIYRAQWWDQGGESVSGPGSTLEFTLDFRRALERFLDQRAVGVLLDAPCGDWNWMKDVSLPAGARYLGGDIVPELVAQLKQARGRENVEFFVFDITRGRFPAADVWLCRDCLIHLSHADVARALENFCASEIPHALLSNYVGSGPNEDIVSGGFRPLDLTREPFLLPEPELRINDWPGKEGVREVCLWPREAIASALARMRGRTAGPAPGAEA